MFAKIYELDPAKARQHMLESLGQYEWIQAYNKAHNITNQFKEEMAICHEMVTLLPQRIARIN
jgi:hypothetical protein